MKMRHSVLVAVLVCTCLSSADAQVNRRTLSTSASEHQFVKPDKLRLTMWIKAQGTDADQSMQSLSEHKERVRQELEALKCDKESIAFSASRVSLLEEELKGTGRMNQLQMQLQVQARGGLPNAKAKPVPLPVVYTARCAMKADWQLPTTADEALAKLHVTLKEQITSRDLAGEKNKAAVTPAEFEQLQELDVLVERYSPIGGDPNSSAAGPRIVFLAKAADDLIQNVSQAAFKKAVAQIETLCMASGTKRGALLNATLNNGPPNYVDVLANRNNSTRAFPTSLLADENGWVSNASADELSITVGINLTYELE